MKKLGLSNALILGVMMLLPGCTVNAGRTEAMSLNQALDICQARQNEHGRRLASLSDKNREDENYRIYEGEGLFDMTACMEEIWPPYLDDSVPGER